MLEQKQLHNEKASTDKLVHQALQMKIKWGNTSLCKSFPRQSLGYLVSIILILLQYLEPIKGVNQQ